MILAGERSEYKKTKKLKNTPCELANDRTQQPHPPPPSSSMYWEFCTLVTFTKFVN